MPVDSVSDPGIDFNLGAPPASQNPSSTGVSGRGSTNLVTSENKHNFQMQLMGTGGGRVEQNATKLRPRNPEPKAAPKPAKTEGLQTVLDFRTPRQQPVDNTNRSQLSPQSAARSATSMPISMLNSLVGTNNNLNKSVQDMAKAPFGGVANALKNVSSGLQSAGTGLATKSPLITSTIQQFSNYTQPPLLKKQSASKLNLLKTMKAVYLHKNAARLCSVLQQVGRV